MQKIRYTMTFNGFRAPDEARIARLHLNGLGLEHTILASSLWRFRGSEETCVFNGAEPVRVYNGRIKMEGAGTMSATEFSMLRILVVLDGEPIKDGPIESPEEGEADVDDNS